MFETFEMCEVGHGFLLSQVILYQDTQQDKDFTMSKAKIFTKSEQAMGKLHSEARSEFHVNELIKVIEKGDCSIEEFEHISDDSQSFSYDEVAGITTEVMQKHFDLAERGTYLNDLVVLTAASSGCYAARQAIHTILKITGLTASSDTIEHIVYESVCDDAESSFSISREDGEIILNK